MKLNQNIINALQKRSRIIIQTVNTGYLEPEITVYKDISDYDQIILDDKYVKFARRTKDGFYQVFKKVNIEALNKSSYINDNGEVIVDLFKV